MIKVAGKEVLFKHTFTLAANERASLTPPELQGSSIDVIAEAIASPTSDNFKIATEGRAAVLTIPYIRANSLSTNFGLGNPGPGNITGRIIGQAAGDFMLVHIEVYIERTPNYGPK